AIVTRSSEASAGTPSSLARASNGCGSAVTFGSAKAAPSDVTSTTLKSETSSHFSGDSALVEPSCRKQATPPAAKTTECDGACNASNSSGHNGSADKTFSIWTRGVAKESQQSTLIADDKQTKSFGPSLKTCTPGSQRSRMRRRLSATPIRSVLNIKPAASTRPLCTILRGRTSVISRAPRNNDRDRRRASLNRSRFHHRSLSRRCKARVGKK